MARGFMDERFLSSVRRLSFRISFEPPVDECAVFHLPRCLPHEAFKHRPNSGPVKSHGIVFRLESVVRLPFPGCSDAFGIVPRMNDGVVGVGDRIKGDT